MKEIALINCVAIICFTVLAVIFGHWWIALFGILFVFGVETEHKEDDNDGEGI